jgi:hypothetical protein
MRVCVPSFFFCGVFGKKSAHQLRIGKSMGGVSFDGRLCSSLFLPKNCLFGCDRPQATRRITSARAREVAGARGRALEKKV